MKAILMTLLFVVTALSQTAPKKKGFVYKTRKHQTTCKTASAVNHEDVVTVTMRVVSWDGCELRGTIRRGEIHAGKGKGRRFNGRVYTLFGGFDSTTKINVKQKIKVTYDRSSGQVLFASFVDNPFSAKRSSSH